MMAGSLPPGKAAVVAIGRNEGERLRRCLASLNDQFARIVYVDSGSTDDSLAIARAAGVTIVELDLARPFTAARARNAGFAALARQGPLPEYVQFIDGDCMLVPGWSRAAIERLDQEPSLGIVTGWRSEIARNATIYNAICDFEWRRPAGEIQACGGDMMVRSTAFQAIGGFDETVIAAEDDEFCVRMRAQGRRIERLPLEMTRHDAAMTRFAQWWKRAVRSGHGFAQVGDLHQTYFRAERRRVWLYGVILPGIALFGSLMSWYAPLLVAGLYVASYARTSIGLIRQGLPEPEAIVHALFLTLSKFPNAIGMIVYRLRRSARQDMTLIEYK